MKVGRYKNHLMFIYGYAEQLMTYPLLLKLKKSKNIKTLTYKMCAENWVLRALWLREWSEENLGKSCWDSISGVNSCIIVYFV